jgi:hypothetical protein
MKKRKLNPEGIKFFQKCLIEYLIECKTYNRISDKELKSAYNILFPYGIIDTMKDTKRSLAVDSA